MSKKAFALPKPKFTITGTGVKLVADKIRSKARDNRVTIEKSWTDPLLASLYDLSKAAGGNESDTVELCLLTVPMGPHEVFNIPQARGSKIIDGVSAGERQSFGLTAEEHEAARLAMVVTAEKAKPRESANA